ncbi:MAG: hypothetical protein JWN40_5775 [Phycisphaerales bacterium]|nr:hypothetical protein [Phycisphaerales bacterium]
MPKPLQISSEEIAAAYADPASAAHCPPILTLSQFAALFQVSLRTVKSWIASGDFQGATTRAGKHRRIWRDRAIQIAFSRMRTRARTT